MRSLRRALGALSAVLFAVAGPLVAVVPAQASAGQSQQPALTAAAVRQPLSVAITGMTPATAKPTSTVTVTGTLTNRSGQSLSGVVLQAWTSTEVFRYPSEMTQFSDGNSPLQLQQAGEQYPVPAPVPNGATVRWSVSFEAGAFYDQFGVFPVEVQATTAYTSYLAAGRTFLPFWPDGTASQPKALDTAWIWPLVDTPQQGACPQTLSTSELERSVASGGRLSTLLGAGSTWAQDDDLTWEIDPALLSDVSVMTKPYFTNGSAVCSGRFARQPDSAASTWLSQLKTSTAGEPAFLTPYADVDAAALSHSGLDNPLLKEAYQVGETVASQILPGTFGENSAGTSGGLASGSSAAASGGQVLTAAYPADGQADAGVLTSLAAYGGINTVVLSSAEVSPATPGDALARTVSGIGTGMSVLLADSSITSLLGTASASPSASDQFNLTQDFLAQTAMVAAEYPATQRSLVIAPPAGWDPSPAEASALLQITHDNAPWLHVTGLSALASAASSLSAVAHIPAKQVSGAELSDPYTDKLGSVASSVSLFTDLLYKPPASQLNSLTAALSVTASSAWRGNGSVGGWRAITQLISYLNDATGKVKLVASKKILLTGKSGETAVSVQNELDEPIEVQVTASTPAGSAVRIGPFNSVLRVQAGGSNTVRMPVHSSSLGTTTVELRLATQNGTPLTWTTQPLSVEVTTFGRSLLLLIFGALGILVLTSAYRLRRKRLAGAKDAGNDETAEAGGTG